MSDDAKTYAVVVHNDAAQMLYRHIRLVSIVSTTAAHKLRNALYDGFASLMNMPHRCPIFRTQRTADIYRQLVIGRYQIIFSIDEDESVVRIQYVLDSRQDNDI